MRAPSCWLMLMLLPGLARGCTVEQLDVLGFSADGRRLAFLAWTPGCETGSSMTLSIVDVDANRFVEPPAVVTDVTGDDGALDEAGRRARGRFVARARALGIVEGHLGHHAVSRGRELGVDAHVARFVAEPLLQAPWQSWRPERGYEVRLITTPAVCEDDATASGLGAQLLRVTVTNEWTGAVTTLQSDARLPRWRRCAFEYALTDVYVLDSRIAVFVRVAVPGFEGPDLRPMVITGVLP